MKAATEAVGATTLPVRSASVAARPRRSPVRGSWRAFVFGVDACMLGLAVVFSDLGAGRAGVPPAPVLWLLALPALTIAILAARGLYRPRLFVRVLDELRAVVTSAAVAAMVVLSLRVLVADDPWVAAQTARLWAFASVYLVAGRAVLAWSELQARRNGESFRPTLIVGAGKVGRMTARRLLAHSEIGLRPVGFLDKEPLDADDGLPVLGASWDLERVAAEHRIEHVVLAFSTAPQRVLLRLVERCQRLGIEVSVVPRFYEKVAGHIGVEYLGGLPLVTAEPSNPRSWHFGVKYALDRVVAAALLLLVSPLMLGAAVAVLLSLGRPVFFRQLRVGRDGKTFWMVKFRTMRGRPDVAGEADADWADQELSGGDLEEAVAEERRTRVGCFLRRFSLDELPQLWNVLVGEMSLVGPRPERMHYVERFQGSIYRYAERHRVKSGITGWAQVNGLRGKTSLADRVEWDNYYIENWSLWLDVKILLLTMLAVVSWRPAD